MRSHSALCLLAVHKRAPRTCFSSEYFRRGLTKCRQKQTADDLLLIASSFFSPSVPPLLTPPLRTFSQASPLFRSLSSSSSFHHSLFSPPSPCCLSYPSLLCSSNAVFYPLSLPCPGCLHLLPPVCPFIPLSRSCASSPFPYPFLSFTPLLSMVLFSACLPACRSFP